MEAEGQTLQMSKRTSNGLESTTQKTKDQETQTLLKPGKCGVERGGGSVTQTLLKPGKCGVERGERDTNPTKTWKVWGGKGGGSVTQTLLKPGKCGVERGGGSVTQTLLKPGKYGVERGGGKRDINPTKTWKVWGGKGGA